MHEITHTSYAEHVSRTKSSDEGFICPVCNQWTRHEHASSAFPKIGELEALCLGCEADALGHPLGASLDQWGDICGTTYPGRLGEGPKHLAPWMDPHAQNERRSNGQTRIDPNQHKGALVAYFRTRGSVARLEQGKAWSEYRTGRDAECIRNDAIRKIDSLEAQLGREQNRAQQAKQNADKADADRKAAIEALEAQLREADAIAGGEA